MQCLAFGFEGRLSKCLTALTTKWFFENFLSLVKNVFELSRPVVLGFSHITPTQCFLIYRKWLPGYEIIWTTNKGLTVVYCIATGNWGNVLITLNSVLYNYILLQLLVFVLEGLHFFQFLIIAVQMCLLV